MVHFTPADEAASTPGAAVAPVTYLPGAAPGMKRRSPLPPPGAPKTVFERSVPGSDAEPGDGPADAEPELYDEVRNEADTEVEKASALEYAENALLQRLRGRSLSTVEATAVLNATDIDEGAVYDVIERFTQLHYLDEVKLADQIIHTHHVRKGLGRPGVEAEMRRRKLDPAVMLDKLEELPDDEAERAIDLAVKRIQQMDRFDDQTIDRRLTGFLMRKGYGSAVVRLAVKAALESRGGSSGGVRFR